ncbi:unnamed protein product [Closterium sp. NIES-53]
MLVGDGKGEGRPVGEEADGVVGEAGVADGRGEEGEAEGVMTSGRLGSGKGERIEAMRRVETALIIARMIIVAERKAVAVSVAMPRRTEAGRTGQKTRTKGDRTAEIGTIPAGVTGSADLRGGLLGVGEGGRGDGQGKEAGAEKHGVGNDAGRKEGVRRGFPRRPGGGGEHGAEDEVGAGREAGGGRYGGRAPEDAGKQGGAGGERVEERRRRGEEQRGAP